MHASSKKNQRAVLVVGGFPYDSERDVNCDKLREMFGHEQGVKDWWTPEEDRISGKGQLPHKRPCVDLPQQIQGQEVQSRGKAAVAHRDRLKEEVLLSERVSLAIKALRTRAVERGILTNGAEMGIDGDWERGRVWFKRLRTDESVITIYRRANSSSSEQVYTGDLIQGWDEELWWNVACVPAGPPTTKNGARSKQAQEFEKKNPARSGEGIIAGLSCACKSSRRQTATWVTETTEGQRVFATPPRPAQRRLAIVVAAAFTKCIVNSSFRVRGRTVQLTYAGRGRSFV